ncbi:Hypothetical predicted protein [Marmota monax]|uniref:Triacylglycerol lipase n=1 Tax=Marmota monax TaxID=9995 RepID=A0A5E4CB33_MARMO|nr:hypothetical protein GHT09_008191 [Marmota monax]VTJ78550.1 Hypothetical predicted protein [Marmota monax]
MIFWTVTLFLLGAATGKEVCYKDIGCFSDSEPWAGTAIRPLKILPWSPEKINTRFLLYTNENPDNFQTLQLSDPSTIEASNFQTDRKTRFIIHGFIDKGDESWVGDMCKVGAGFDPRWLPLSTHRLSDSFYPIAIDNSDNRKPTRICSLCAFKMLLFTNFKFRCFQTISAAGNSSICHENK